MPKREALRKASIIVATHNRADILERTLTAMLDQDFQVDYEVIVVDDCSNDNTKDVLEKFPEVRKIILEENLGPAAARNLGIKAAKYPVVVVMDDDCIPSKKWLKELVSPFSGKVGMTTSFSIYGGTSTAFLKRAVEEAGYFDETFPFEFREDTDLVFRVMDLGYEVRFVEEAKFEHLHRTPKGVAGKIRYALKRVWIHQVDPLLFKKHPARTKKFMKVKLGFMVDPKEDLYKAIGKWQNGRALSLSSPQGVVLISGKTPLHKLVILLLGLVYLISIKSIRLYGSLKYGKLLI